MSFMDKVKSFFSGGSSAGADEHAGHDHSAHDMPSEPAAPMPPADPAGMPTSDAGTDGGEDRPA
jgi:hypothetical protein